MRNDIRRTNKQKRAAQCGSPASGLGKGNVGRQPKRRPDRMTACGPSFLGIRNITPTAAHCQAQLLASSKLRGVVSAVALAVFASALAGCASQSVAGGRLGGRPVDHTCFDQHFARIGQGGQSPCLDFAGSNFIAMRSAGQQVRFVIGRWSGRDGESLHAWVVDQQGQIVDFVGMGGPERYRPPASFDGTQRYWHLEMDR